MHRFSEFCTPPKHAFPSQLLFLKDKVERAGGSLSVVHKFLFKIKIAEETFFVKANLMDNEFYLFSKTRPIAFFPSFHVLKMWLFENFLAESKEMS